MVGAMACIDTLASRCPFGAVVKNHNASRGQKRHFKMVNDDRLARTTSSRRI